MAKNALLGGELFDFLRDLKANNDRDWFQTNKKRYETHVLKPVQGFIEALRKPLARLSPHLVADPSRTGGSMFRINRDIRFSRDKSPYKTHTGVYFFHAHGGRKGAGPGLYLHLEPGHCFFALGVHSVLSPQIKPIRQAIADKPEDWKKVKDHLEKTGWILGGESLKTAPRGFDRNHPCIEDIRRIDYYVNRTLSEQGVLEPDFPGLLVDQAIQAAPLGRYLAGCLDMPW